MTKKNKKIPVSFIQYRETQFERFKKHSEIKQVSEITRKQANEFLRLLATLPVDDVDYADKRYCMANYIEAEYNCSSPLVSLGEDRYSPLKNYIPDAVFIIHNFWWRWPELRCIQNKRACTRLTKREGAMHVCAESMRNGKCVDPIMRKLAAMMFPEKYSNDKDQR